MILRHINSGGFYELPPERVAQRYARWQDSPPNGSFRADSFDEEVHGILLPLKADKFMGL